MKLYYSKGACSLAERIIINELGLACEYEAVNLKTKQTESGQDYWTINPKGAVPFLVIDEHKALSENAVILQYLAESHKAYTLLPEASDFKRYHVLEWLNFVATDIHKGAGINFNPLIPSAVKEQVLIPAFKNKLNFVEKHLTTHAYLAGEHFTLPDAYFFVMLSWLPKLKLDIHEWSAIASYYAKLKLRPSIAKSLLDEGFEI